MPRFHVQISTRLFSSFSMFVRVRGEPGNEGRVGMWLCQYVEPLLSCMPYHTLFVYRGFQVGWGNSCRVAKLSCMPDWITSQMIYHRGGEPEREMHCWFNVMAHKPAEFATVCCSMSVVSNTLCSHFFGQWSYSICCSMSTVSNILCSHFFSQWSY